MNSKGFTLIELAVVLAIIAVLAAVLTPMVTNYIDQSRIARAQADLRTIADAIKLHKRDTGRYPIYDSGTDYTNDTAANTVIGGSGGTNPTDNSGGSSWSIGSSVATTSLELYLNNNYSGVGAATFPKANFNGPYIGIVDSDPWGNKYLLTAANLKQTGTPSTYHAYVISAGPNGALDIIRDVAVGSALSTAGTDDLIAVIK